MNKLKEHWTTIILIFVFIVGLSLLLYPTVSNYWNSLHQSRVIASYTEAVADIDNETYQKILTAARNYNTALSKRGICWTLTDDELAEYEAILNVSENGVMGYVDIPCIDVYLPVYYGTDDAVLQMGVGHLEGTSFPVGGESSHCVISGHRGLPSAKLFTNLDQMTEGDLFQLHVLDETLTYEVDQILIVEPDDLSALSIVEGEDYCTLITCTPYGINTHRLLVRGHRAENDVKKRTVRITADAMQIEPLIVASLAAVPMLLLLVIALLVRTHRKK